MQVEAVRPGVHSANAHKQKTHGKRDKEATKYIIQACLFASAHRCRVHSACKGSRPLGGRGACTCGCAAGCVQVGSCSGVPRSHARCRQKLTGIILVPPSAALCTSVIYVHVSRPPARPPAVWDLGGVGPALGGDGSTTPKRPRPPAYLPACLRPASAHARRKGASPSAPGGAASCPAWDLPGASPSTWASSRGAGARGERACEALHLHALR